MIDIVIPHVDGAAPGYEALSRRYTGDWVPCQVRELGTLRFVMRSIGVNLPWIRQVVLAVQDDGNLPNWLARHRFGSCLTRISFRRPTCPRFIGRVSPRISIASPAWPSAS